MRRFPDFASRLLIVAMYVFEEFKRIHIGINANTVRQIAKHLPEVFGTT